MLIFQGVLFCQLCYGKLVVRDSIKMPLRIPIPFLSGNFQQSRFNQAPNHQFNRSWGWYPSTKLLINCTPPKTITTIAKKKTFEDVALFFSTWLVFPKNKMSWYLSSIPQNIQKKKINLGLFDVDPYKFLLFDVPLPQEKKMGGSLASPPPPPLHRSPQVELHQVEPLHWQVALLQVVPGRLQWRSLGTPKMKGNT